MDGSWAMSGCDSMFVAQWHHMNLCVSCRHVYTNTKMSTRTPLPRSKSNNSAERTLLAERSVKARMQPLLRHSDEADACVWETVMRRSLVQLHTSPNATKHSVHVVQDPGLNVRLTWGSCAARLRIHYACQEGKNEVAPCIGLLNFHVSPASTWVALEKE